jgi:hypothetical protein
VFGVHGLFRCALGGESWWRQAQKYKIDCAEGDQSFA